MGKKVAGGDVSVEGGVDWLKLGDAGGSLGVEEVFRVETVGGFGECDGGEKVEVGYAALYWFYG